MTANKLTLFVIGCLCIKLTLAQNAPLIIQQSSAHSIRIRLSDKAGVPDNPAFIRHDWGSPVDIKSNHAAVSGLDIQVSYNPLTINITNKNKTVSQTFTVDQKTGELSFGIDDGPVLGLGEGSEKFDKRGAFYPMKNGQ